MALGHPLSPLTVAPAERQRLLEWTRRPTSAQALALHARIVLLCAEGRSNTEVARRVHVALATAFRAGEAQQQKNLSVPNGKQTIEKRFNG